MVECVFVYLLCKFFSWYRLALRRHSTFFLTHPHPCLCTHRRLPTHLEVSVRKPHLHARLCTPHALPPHLEVSARKMSAVVMAAEAMTRANILVLCSVLYGRERLDESFRCWLHE